MIDDYTIQKIKDAANIVDVVADFYPFDTPGGLKKMGMEYSCPCPFHGGRHYGSFKVSPKLNIAKCFSCNWSGDPIEFLMEHEHLSFLDAIRWLGKKYCIEVEGSENFEVRPAQPRKQLPSLPMLVLPEWMWKIRFGLDESNPFGKWLFGLNWDNVQRDRLYQVLSDYRVGTSKNGMVIWWQIDEQQRVRTGKMMLYHANGHRVKEDESNYTMDWIHSALYRDNRNDYSADKTDKVTCPFGLHLLNHYKQPNVQQDVCIVESEKTALLMAIAYGNHAGQVWMACGGKSNLTREKLKPIIDQRRNIVIYPDRDGVDEWKRKADTLQYDHVFVETKWLDWWQPCDGEKADIADIVVRCLGKKIYKTVSDIMEDIPSIKMLKEKLNLEKI